MNAETAAFGEVPRWAVMWLLAGGLFAAGKVFMLSGSGLCGRRAVAFIFTWPGMDTEPFSGRATMEAGPVPGWGAPFRNMLLGSVLLFGVARGFDAPVPAGWTGMVGLIFLLHFGVFGLLAAGWRVLGVPVTPIMRCPIAATSLTEFWGRRWNLAFRDLVHCLVFRPMTRCWGGTAALWAAFAVSGLAHELVISVPAGAGYGLPTAYFLLQALGMALERGRRPSWWRTHAFTLLPVGLVFHPPFVERVMVPFFHAIGALP